MRKQTKLVAVLSAAALLALGASMTSFAAGWEKDEAGIWHYYDADGDMVENEWKKDGGKWFYLDDDGDMLTNSWIDDEYYVGEDGAMVVNGWVKTLADEDQDNPDDDGEHWYFFNSKGKKVTNDTRKINGKTYLFDDDGAMQYGWQMIGTDGYYFGEEDEGWRAENQWLWLEKSGNLDVADEDEEQDHVYGCYETDSCDDEGWYWFGSAGKVEKRSGKRKINGKYYMFNDHGQMLYEWINTNAANKLGSNAQLDGALASNANTASASDMVYYNAVEDGSRAKGWYEIAGSEDVGSNNNTKWYYIDDGGVTAAKKDGTDYAATEADGTVVNVKREKIKESGNKYFCFNDKGEMQTGLQYLKASGGFYYFDDNGYQQSGKVSSVECDDDDYAFYFTAKNGKNGIGYTGEKDGYLYFNGKRLEADDDYRFYYVDGKIYLVNTKGKIQKATGSNGKDYDDIENAFYENSEDITVKTNKNGVVESIEGVTDTAMITELKAAMVLSTFDATDLDSFTKISVPSISLYDNVYTYAVFTDGSIKETW